MSRSNITKLVAWSLAIAAFVLGGVTRADVIEPPLENCPEGSSGATSHCGPYCDPRTCTDDSNCVDGRRCLDVALCVERVNCSYNGEPNYSDHIMGSCGGGATCGRGECRTLRVCAFGTVEPDASVLPDADTHHDASPDADDTARDDDFQVRTWGCGCRSGSTRAPAGLAALGLVAVCLALGAVVRRG
jgi:hypothetical protein